MQTKELKKLSNLKLTKNIIIPFPNFQQNTIISPTQINDNFEEIEYAYNNLIDNHNGAIQTLDVALNEIIINNDEIVSNEEERIRNEQERITAYNTHVSNEAERVKNEQERINAYNVHASNERRREESHSNMINTFDLKIEEVNNLLTDVSGYVSISVFESTMKSLMDKISVLEEEIKNNAIDNPIVGKAVVGKSKI